MATSTSGAIATTAGRHTLAYRVRNHDLADPWRHVEVVATPEEIGKFARDGFLVRERLLNGEHTEQLRRALDEVAAVELGIGAKVNRSSRFGGLFLRHLMDKHQAFLDMLRFPPLLSVARAVLGPQVALRGFSARISYPDEPHQETHWHFHQRLVPDPLPPFFTRPQTIEALLYLDGATDANGPLCVMPGSHQRIEEDLAAERYDDLPGQVTLRLPPGSCVFLHGSAWHRAMPNTPAGTVRRLLIIGYGPTWLKPSIYGQKPEHELTERLLADNPDQETKELLGVAGWM